jgi:hypothetical protein
MYHPGNTAETDIFIIRLYENVPVVDEQNPVGYPEISPFYEWSGVSGNRVDTGINANESVGEDVFEYTANIPPIQLEGGVTYWIAIMNDTTNDLGDTWYWATNYNPLEQTGNSTIRLLGLDIPILYGYSPLAFQLTGSPIIPEPASMVLLGLGMAGLFVRNRMRCRPPECR